MIELNLNHAFVLLKLFFECWLRLSKNNNIGEMLLDPMITIFQDFVRFFNVKQLIVFHVVLQKVGPASDGKLSRYHVILQLELDLSF